MQRFSFPLDSAMELRRVQFEREQARLAELQRELRSYEQAWQHLETEKQAAEQALQTQAVVPAGELAALDQFRNQTERRKRGWESRIASCRTTIAEQSTRVQEAQRAFRLLEVLKQRRRDAWQKDYDREQENLAAELHLAKQARQAAR
jgi:flagellar export protein FliJ